MYLPGAHARRWMTRYAAAEDDGTKVHVVNVISDKIRSALQQDLDLGQVRLS